MKKVFISPLFAATLFCSIFFHACQKENTPTAADNEVSSVSDTGTSDRCMCLTPYTVTISEIGSTAASITWDAMPESIGYQVEWLIGNNNPVIDTAMLSVAYTESNTMLLSNLKPDRHYAVRVFNVCRLNSSDPAAWIAFKTAPKAAISLKKEAIQN